MLKLVIITDTTAPMTYCFDQSIVTIGSGSSSYADVAIPGDTVQERHIEIVKEHSQYIVINIANDPFTTLNGHPFGKKIIKNQDLVQIGNTTLRFELTAALAETVPFLHPIETANNIDPNAIDLVDTKEILPILVEEVIAEHEKIMPEMPPVMEYPPWHDEEGIPEYCDQPEAWIQETLGDDIAAQFNANEMQPFDLDTLVRQVEELADNDEAYQKYHEAVSQSSPKESLADEVPEDIPTIFAQNHLAVPVQNIGKPIQDTTTPDKDIPLPVIPPTHAISVDPQEALHSVSAFQIETHPAQTNSKQKQSLKDYYLSEYDDVTEPNNKAPANTASNLPKILFIIKNWRLYLKIFIAFILAAAIGAGLVFLWMSDQSDKEEITASRGVADVAMALTYAQIKHIRPQNQNWSDPEFIKNNLMAVIASRYSSLAEFDTHGQFTNSPYMLRIYTSGDLSQFLVIAQPAPSLLQWLIPKTTIILDSRTMEMRKIKDLKTLNRLLVNTNTLDGTNAVELSNLIQQGTLIPLSHLVNKNENHGFSPPKALGLLHPGAENPVYNAPRYHLLGEELMKKSIDLIEKPASSHEVAMLQQELASLNKFPNAVLYSSGGLQHAIQAQRALATLAPKEKFLIAYLQINPKGNIVNSHMLMDDTPQDVAIADVGKKPQGHQVSSTGTDVVGAFKDPKDPLSTSQGLPDSGHQEAAFTIKIDEDNPLFLQLSALSVFRQQALRTISEEMSLLLNKETQSGQPNFASQFQQLLNKYLEINNEQQAKIARKLDGIYRENTHLPASEFLNLSKAAGLLEPLKDYLGTLKRQLNIPEFTQEKMDKRLQKIEKAANWQDLEQIVAETVEVLQLDKIPEEERIIAYQTATRSRVIQKLNQFLLSPEHSLPPQAYDSEYRYTLINILKMSWINDCDTCDFYLGEFDLRTNPRNQEQDEEEDEEIA